jgi:hypothetical protein
LDGYILTFHSKAQVLEVCEANKENKMAFDKPKFIQENSQIHKVSKRQPLKLAQELVKRRRKF